MTTTMKRPLWWVAGLGLGLALATACAESTPADSGTPVLDPAELSVRWEAEGLRVDWRGEGPLRFGLAAHGNAPQPWAGEDCSAGAVCHELEGSVLLLYGAAPGAVVPGRSTAFHPSDAGGPPGHRTLEEHARGTSYYAEWRGQCVRWSAGAAAYAPWHGCSDW